MNAEQNNIAVSVSGMSRKEVQKEIMHFKGRFKLDFSQDFLETQPLEQLRHILMAALLQQQREN